MHNESRTFQNAYASNPISTKPQLATPRIGYIYLATERAVSTTFSTVPKLDEARYVKNGLTLDRFSNVLEERSRYHSSKHNNLTTSDIIVVDGVLKL